MTRTVNDLADELARWLRAAVESSASDLHLVVGHPPVLRVHGELQPLSESVLQMESLEPILLSACPPQFVDEFRSELNLDFATSIQIGDVNQRFRANYFFNHETIGACFRVIPSTIDRKSVV